MTRHELMPGKSAAVSQLPRRILIAQVVALLAVLGLVWPAEVSHWREMLAADDLFGINVDTTLPSVLILLLPYFWFVRRPFWSSRAAWWSRWLTWWSAGAGSSRPIVAPTLVAATSLFVCWHTSAMRVGDREQYTFGELPPAYHDEYSYLFQAQTMLAGRWSFPSHPTAARLFDQMHVVNEGQFASRYFPGTGFFVAPWLWLGWPVFGHFLAGAVTCVLVFGIGRELANNGTGFLAGMLTALSPGMALFGNLLLAHHPTLIGLFFFAWSFLRWLRRDALLDLTCAGFGLSWAMLCRPMTAAGFGLPFGVVFVWKLWKLTRNVSEGERSTPSAFLRPQLCWLRSWLCWLGPRSRFGLVWRPILAMSLPLLAGFVVLGIQNRAITGRVTLTPYQLFTDIYTPRHGYGFNNVVRGEQRLGPRVLDQYDRWAVNLTPALAVENTLNRLIAACQWTLGLVPILASVMVLVVGYVASGPRPSDRNARMEGAFGNVPHARDRRVWLVLAAIVSLFAVHVPYWFDGMFHWHYVFETGPLWCLLVALATDLLVRSWLAAERPRMPVWWGFVIASAVVVNVTDFAPFWYPSKLQAGVEQIAFSRLRYQAFNEMLQRDVTQRPALVLIKADAADRHIDYVVNDPALSSDVLRARYPVADWPLERIVAEFPDRAVYLFDAKAGTLRLMADKRR
jgi:hypothetical protein